MKNNTKIMLITLGIMAMTPILSSCNTVRGTVNGAAQDVNAVVGPPTHVHRHHVYIYDVYHVHHVYHGKVMKSKVSTHKKAKVGEVTKTTETSTTDTSTTDTTK